MWPNERAHRKVAVEMADSPGAHGSRDDPGAFEGKPFSHQGKYYTIPLQVPYRGHTLKEITLVPAPERITPPGDGVRYGISPYSTSPDCD